MSARATPSSAARGVPLTWMLRLGVSALVLFALFRIVPVAQVWSQAQRIAPPLWLGALGLFLVGHAAATVKWRLLIGHGVSFPQAFQAHLAGLAANLCLPGLGGGDVVRAALVYRSAQDHSRLVVGSVADRMIDILGLLLFAVAGALLAVRPGQNDLAKLSWVLAGGIAAIAIAFPASLAIERKLGNRAPRGRAGRVLAHAVGAAAYLVRRPGRLALCLAISMAIQATFIGINIAFATAVQVAAPIAAWFFAWSTAKIVAVAPISLGGLGVREAVMASLLSGFGADPAQVIAIGLIWQTVLYASGLVGVAAQLIRNPEASRVARRTAEAARRPS
ncbi:MAG TPA: lysylphosphatidylglycerol synthase transmembrane domain-containing protein [Casimicrobiaceae bacterium]|nr:lysylphosphatidylglycerol synthase transmembrane domain-containing protein [Casimicrobiaceae bacterium]